MDTEPLISLIVSAVALVVSRVTSQRQEADTRRISDEQLLLQRRQTVFELWKYLTDAPDIDPAAPIYPDVLKVVNTLKLVAVCWEGDITDRNLIRRTFGARFVELYEALERVPAGGRWRSGRERLAGHPAVQKLYADLKAERLSAGALDGLDL